MLRAGQGPFVLECVTHRVRGHIAGDAQKYRDADEIKGLDAHDPLGRARLALQAAGTPEAELDAIDARIAAQVDAAVEAARADALPSFEAAVADVYTQEA